MVGMEISFLVSNNSATTNDDFSQYDGTSINSIIRKSSSRTSTSTTGCDETGRNLLVSGSLTDRERKDVLLLGLLELFCVFPGRGIPDGSLRGMENCTGHERVLRFVFFFFFRGCLQSAHKGRFFLLLSLSLLAW